MHKHQCGFALPLTDFLFGQEAHELSLEPRLGCGAEWEHMELMDDPTVTEEQLRREHMCPACGKGPWTWKKEPATIKQRAKECIMLGVDERVTAEGLQP